MENDHLILRQYLFFLTKLTQFTGVFAKQGGNVSGMISQAKGEYAYSILDIDKVPTEDDINALLAIDGVIKVRAI